MVLLLALEGVICLLMAFPIAAVRSVVGAIVGWAIATNSQSARRGQPAAMLLLLPLLAFGESKVTQPTLRHVTTTIAIDAPPERVWPNVIGFSDLPAAPDWISRLGIAYAGSSRRVLDHIKNRSEK